MHSPKQLLRTPAPHKSILLILIPMFALLWSWSLWSDASSLAGKTTIAKLLVILCYVLTVGCSVWIMWHAFRFIHAVTKQFRGITGLITAYCLFVFADFVVAWLINILWLGPHGRLDSLLPLGSPALLVINTPLAFASRFIGFFGLGGAIWLLIYLVVHKRAWRQSFLLLGAISSISLVGFAVYQPQPAATLQASVTRAEASRSPSIASKDDPTLVVLPEFGLNGFSPDTDRISAQDSKTGTKSHGYYIGSMQTNQFSPAARSNTLVFGSSQQTLVQRQNKHRLIPLGEDLPYLVHGILRLSGQTKTLDFFASERSIIPSSQQLKPFRTNTTDLVVGGAVCSSIISTRDYRLLTRDGATILTNSAALGVFNNSRVFTAESSSLARFMAIANDRYFLQSSTDGTLLIINHNGRILAQTTKQETLQQQVATFKARTLYTLLGEWVVLVGEILCLVMIVCFAWSRYK